MVMKITPNVVASLVGGKIEGDGDVEITGFAKIEEAKKGDISFISNPKYAHFAETTSASALLVSTNFKSSTGLKPTLIKVADPYMALATLMAHFSGSRPSKTGIEEPSHIGNGSRIGENIYIGSFAYIGDGVTIGDNVKIYPHAYIGDNVEIGDETIVYPHATVYGGCIVGKRCVLHSGSVVGADGFGFAPTADGYLKIPQIGNVILEDDVEIGANTTVDRATMGSTVIGRGTKLDNLIQVAHNVRIGQDNVIAAQTGIAGSTQMGDRNRIGGQVGIAGHIKFGSDCEVGAQSGIPKGYGDGRRIIGYPAVDAIDFAKAQVHIKRLQTLFADVEKIKKEINKD